MQHPVAVALKGGAAADAAILITFIELPSTRGWPMAGIGCKAPVFPG